MYFSYIFLHIYGAKKETHEQNFTCGIEVQNFKPVNVSNSKISNSSFGDVLPGRHSIASGWGLLPLSLKRFTLFYRTAKVQYSGHCNKGPIVMWRGGLKVSTQPAPSEPSLRTTHL